MRFRLPRPPLLAALAGIVATALLVLGPLHPHPAWIHLQAPDRAVPGTPFRVVVQVGPDVPGNFITVDLHGRAAPPAHRGVLAAGTHQRLTPRLDSYSFDFLAPADASAIAISCVVYLSDSGNWESRRLVAHSAPIPLVAASSAPPASGSPPLHAHPMFPLNIGSQTAPRDSVVVRLGCALLLALAAIYGFILQRNLESGRGAPLPQAVTRMPRLWALVFAGSAILVGLGWGDVLADLTRKTVTALGIYERRHASQMVLTVAVVGLAAGLAPILLQSLRRAGLSPIPAALFLAYALLSGLTTLSLHGIDALNATLVPGLSRFDALRLGLSAGVALFSLHEARRMRPRTTETQSDTAPGGP